MIEKIPIPDAILDKLSPYDMLKLQEILDAAEKVAYSMGFDDGTEEGYDTGFDHGYEAGLEDADLEGR